MKEITLQEQDASQRFDRFLKKVFNKIPQSVILKWIRTKKVKVNNKKTPQNTMLQPGDIISFFLSEDELKQSKLEKKNSKPYLKKTPYKNLKIIYEDDDIIAINKPYGISVHQGGNKQVTLTDILRFVLQGKKDTLTFKPSFAHRLDKYTSGVILACKTPHAIRTYAEFFREHSGEKVYVALVKGILKNSEGTITKSIQKFDFERGKVRIDKDGKESLTKYKVIETIGEDASLVEIYLKTGRQHQIRIHFQSMGHPVIGDRVYGEKRINEFFRKNYGIKRLCLHAKKLVIPNLNGDGERVLEANVPREFWGNIKQS